MDPLKRSLANETMLSLMNVVEMLGELEVEELPGKVVSCFLYVARHNGCHKQALEEDLDISPSSGSRIAA